MCVEKLSLNLKSILFLVAVNKSVFKISLCSNFLLQLVHVLH